MVGMADPLQHDSDSMIPPGEDPRHSYVPYMKAPSSVGSFPLTSSGADSSSVGGLSSVPTAETPGARSSRSRSTDTAPVSIAGLKDWELDLDALKVCMQQIFGCYCKGPALPQMC